MNLTAGEGEAVGGEDLVHGLEVGGSASAAVTRATGGDTLGLGTRVEGASRVSGLGADVGLGETGDTALGVVDGGAERADGAAVDAGGGAGAADGGTDGGSGAAGHGDGSAAVVVDAALVGVGAGAADPREVTAAGEDGAGEGTDRDATGGGGRGTGATAVAGGDESTGHGETDGAAGGAADEVGVTTADGGEGGGKLRDGANFELGLGETSLLGEVSGLGGSLSEGLEDELVGGDVDEVGGDTGLGALEGGLDEDLVKGLLGLVELGEAVGDDLCGGTGLGDLGGQGLVSDGDGEVAVDEPSTTEGLAGQSLELSNDFGSLEFAGNTNVSLFGVKSQVALHGSQDFGVEVVGGLGGGTVDDGEEDCQGSNEFGELHDG